jgi:hypothetical protein
MSDFTCKKSSVVGGRHLGVLSHTIRVFPTEKLAFEALK